MALALGGATDQALQVIGELDQENPSNTQIQEASIPIAMSAVLLANGDPAGAVSLLERARPYQRGYLLALYLRGGAYLALNDGAAASAEFSELLELEGVEPTRPIHTLAHLGRARALAMSGLTDASREEYETFFEIVADADPGLPVVTQARAEYAAL
jgi:tetratricopeptide (TPR) repeat protein